MVTEVWGILFICIGQHTRRCSAVGDVTVARCGESCDHDGSITGCSGKCACVVCTDPGWCKLPKSTMICSLYLHQRPSLPWFKWFIAVVFFIFDLKSDKFTAQIGQTHFLALVDGYICFGLHCYICTWHFIVPCFEFWLILKLVRGTFSSCLPSVALFDISVVELLPGHICWFCGWLFTSRCFNSGMTWLFCTRGTM